MSFRAGIMAEQVNKKLKDRKKGGERRNRRKVIEKEGEGR